MFISTTVLCSMKITINDVGYLGVTNRLLGYSLLAKDRY